MMPSARTSRAGNPREASQSGAAADLIMAAVLAVLASTQVAAATVAAAQQLLADRPVRGSTMWCSVLRPRRQVRDPVVEVASPPALIATTGPGPMSAPSVTIWMRQPLA